MTDYYSILGLDRDCSRDDIRNAYRRLAKQYHPDVNKSPDAPEKFRKISEAYEYLLKVKDGAQPDIPAYAASGSGAGRTAAGGRQYNVRTLEEIMTALKSDDNTVVMAAIEALGSRRFYENQAVMHVLATYLHSQDILLRRSAVIALGRLGNPAAITDLAKMLKDEEPHVRFDAIVALGNIGAPAALAYLEIMDRNDHRNNEMVMNARDESVYSIKKNSGMYGTERKCPYCSGYDGKSKSGPYKCHECGRTFGTADRQSKEKSKSEGMGSGKQCVTCHSESRLGQCKYCGQTYCSSHIGPEEHQCSHRNQEGTAENHAGMKRPRHSKAVRNLAILAVMLALVMIIGAIVALSTDHSPEGPGPGGLTATVTPAPTLHPFQDYIGTWHSYEANESVPNMYDHRYLVIYPDYRFTMRHDTQDRQDIFHGVWSNHGLSGLILNYNDGTVQDIPASQQFVIDETYKDAAFAYYVNGTGGRTSVGMLFKKMSSTPGMYVPST